MKEKLPYGIRYTKFGKDHWDYGYQILASSPGSPNRWVQQMVYWSEGDFFCGPKLWARIKDKTAYSILPGSKKAMFEGLVGNQVTKLEGRYFMSRKVKSQFWSHVINLLGPQETWSIRRANAEEIRQYWDLVNYDLLGSIYLVQTKQFKLLVHSQNLVRYVDIVS